MANFTIMKTLDVKSLLSEVMSKLTPESTLEDVYEQLALLSDISISEEQERNGEVYTNEEMKRYSQEWISNNVLASSVSSK